MRIYCKKIPCVQFFKRRYKLKQQKNLKKKESYLTELKEAIVNGERVKIAELLNRSPVNNQKITDVLNEYLFKVNSFKTIKYLIELGADPKTIDKYGRTLYFKARTYSEICYYAGLNQIDVNKTDKEGRTVLIKAAMKNKFGIVKALLKNKNLTISNQYQGKSAENWALKNKSWEVVRTFHI